MHGVWGENFYGDDNLLDVYIRYLRQKVELDGPCSDPHRPGRWFHSQGPVELNHSFIRMFSFKAVFVQGFATPAQPTSRRGRCPKS